MPRLRPTGVLEGRSVAGPKGGGLAPPAQPPGPPPTAAGPGPIDTARPSNSLADLEWPTLWLIAGCYALWFLSGLVIYPLSPILGTAFLGICIALHSSLQHEALHGHPTRDARLNEALVFLPIGLFYPYRSYRDSHLLHHQDERLTDPYDDPESSYRAFADWLRLPGVLKVLLTINGTLVGRVVLGPPLNVAGFVLAELRQASLPRVKAWFLHLAGLVPVLLVVRSGFGIPVWQYALTAAYLGLALTAVRAYCEHQWSQAPEGRTIIVERSVLAPLFLYNNLHIVHHRLPWLPWYRLPRVYREGREEWQRLNGGYVFPSYWSILRAFAFRVKEPVIHPVLRRTDAAASRRTASCVDGRDVGAVATGG